MGVPVTYTLTVTNLGPGTAFGVVASEGLSLSASVDSATPSQGSCTLLAHGASCALGIDRQRRFGDGRRRRHAVGSEGTLTSNAAVVTSGLDTESRPTTARPSRRPSRPVPSRRRRSGGPLGPGRDARPDRVDELGRRARPRVDAHRRNHHRRPGHTHADLRVGRPGNRRCCSRSSTRSARARSRPSQRHDLRQLRRRPFRRHLSDEFINAALRNGVTGRLRRWQLLPGQPRDARADGRLPSEGQVRRRPRTSPGDGHGLRRRSAGRLRRRLDRGARVPRASPAAAAAETTAPTRP